MLCGNALSTHVRCAGFDELTVYAGQYLVVDADGRTVATRRGRVHSFEDPVRLRKAWRAPGGPNRPARSPVSATARPGRRRTGSRQPSDQDYDLWAGCSRKGPGCNTPRSRSGCSGSTPTRRHKTGGARRSRSSPATRLVARAEHLAEEERQEILADLRAYEREYWRGTGRLAKLGLPSHLVVRLRTLLTTRADPFNGTRTPFRSVGPLSRT